MINKVETLTDLGIKDLIFLSDKEYFKQVETLVNRNYTLDQWTNFFSTEPYVEVKPYLFRRQLIPTDNRFSQIELVYGDDKIVRAIFWELKMSLSQLIECFGKPITHNSAYDGSTEFAFKSKNPQIEIIITRFPGWLVNQDNLNFECVDGDGLTRIISDPEFRFISFLFAKPKPEISFFKKILSRLGLAD